MFISLILTGFIVAAGTPKADALNKLALPFRRTFTRSTGEVDGPALLRSLQQTLNKYHSRITIPEASATASLRRRLATENLLDQVEDPDFDEDYYGPMQVGYRTGEQVFTVQFDTGSADIFIPGPQCTIDKGCSSTRKYDEGGTSQGRSTTVQYGSGFVEGDDYTDSVNVVGLTATGQGLISLTQASGFNTSSSDGLLGMGFTSIAASGFTTFFENLMMQSKVGTFFRLSYLLFLTTSGASSIHPQNIFQPSTPPLTHANLIPKPQDAPEFSFYLGRAASGSAQRSSLCLGCRDPSRYVGAFTQVPVTQAAYWQIALDSVNVNGLSAGYYTTGQAIIDTGTTLILAPTAAAYAIFELIPDAFPIPLAGSSDQTFFAYPCSMPAPFVPTIQFAGKSFAINPLDFNFGLLTSSFARLMGNETLAVRLETKMAAGAVEGAGEADDASTETCVAAIVGTDVSPQGDLYVVGDAFLKNWYTTFNYVDAGGQPSVSFAEAV